MFGVDLVVTSLAFATHEASDESVTIQSQKSFLSFISLLVSSRLSFISPLDWYRLVRPLCYVCLASILMVDPVFLLKVFRSKALKLMFERLFIQLFVLSETTLNIRVSAFCSV